MTSLIVKEDLPKQPKAKQTFRVRFRQFSPEDPAPPDLDLEGFGLRMDSDVAQILGEQDVIAMFPKTDIVGIWPIAVENSSRK